MEIQAYSPGAFCFPELNTRDVSAAKRFYAAVLGWTTFDVPSAQGSYSLARADGKDVAGIHLASRGEASWLHYVSVDSADRIAARAAELGGKVEAAPFDVHGVGPYTIAKIAEQSVAGLMSVRKEWGKVKAHWSVYFAVPDCARAVAETRTRGGMVITEPKRVQNFGRFAVLADPEHAAFCVVEP